VVGPLLRTVLIEGPIGAVEDPIGAGALFSLVFDRLLQAPAAEVANSDVANSKVLTGLVNLFVTEAGVHANDNRNLLPEGLPDLFGQVSDRFDRGVPIVRGLRAASQDCIRNKDRIRNKAVPRDLKCQPGSPGKRVAGRLDLIDRIEVLGLAKCTRIGHLTSDSWSHPLGGCSTHVPAPRKAVRRINLPNGWLFL